MARTNHVKQLKLLIRDCRSTGGVVANHEERIHQSIATILPLCVVERTERLAQEQLSEHAMIGGSPVVSKTVTVLLNTKAWKPPTGPILRQTIAAAVEIRRHLLEALRELELRRGEFDTKAAKSTKSSRGQRPNRISERQATWLQRWRLFHEAVATLEDRHQNSWMLAHYLGLDSTDYECLTGDLDFDVYNRRARALIQSAISEPRQK